MDGGGIVLTISSTVALLVAKETFVFVKWLVERRNGNGTEQILLKQLQKQGEILARQTDILSSIKDLEHENGGILKELINGMTVNLTRQENMESDIKEIRNKK